MLGTIFKMFNFQSVEVIRVKKKKFFKLLKNDPGYTFYDDFRSLSTLKNDPQVNIQRWQMTPVQCLTRGNILCNTRSNEALKCINVVLCYADIHSFFSSTSLKERRIINMLDGSHYRVIDIALFLI